MLADEVPVFKFALICASFYARQMGFNVKLYV